MSNSILNVLISGEGMCRVWGNVFIVSENAEMGGKRFGDILRSPHVSFTEQVKENKPKEGGFTCKPEETSLEELNKALKNAVAGCDAKKYAEIKRLIQLKGGTVETNSYIQGKYKITEKTWKPNPPVELSEVPTEELLDELMKRTEEEIEYE